MQPSAVAAAVHSTPIPSIYMVWFRSFDYIEMFNSTHLSPTALIANSFFASAKMDSVVDESVRWNLNDDLRWNSWKKRGHLVAFETLWYPPFSHRHQNNDVQPREQTKWERVIELSAVN